MDLLPPQEGFLGLNEADSVSYEQARVVVIPFGLESSVSYGGGTGQGPRAILQASHEVELYDDVFECESFRSLNIVTLKEPQIAQATDQALLQLSALVDQVLRDKKFPLVLGGEHAITAGAIRPFAASFSNLVIVHFDAHADLRDGYEGNPYSHASALRRCLDDVEVLHRGSHLSLFSFGIRNISLEEKQFAVQNEDRIRIFYASQKKRWDFSHFIEGIKGRPVYITFDVDAFDASLMPATGTPEPGGLFWDDVMDILALVREHAAVVVGADINELAPIPSFHASDFTVAKLAYRMLSFALL